MSQAQDAGAHLGKLRDAQPLVHNITNYVVMNFSANALLALGASPIMAHALDGLRCRQSSNFEDSRCNIDRAYKGITLGASMAHPGGPVDHQGSLYPAVVESCVASREGATVIGHEDDARIVEYALYC